MLKKWSGEGKECGISFFFFHDQQEKIFLFYVWFFFFFGHVIVGFVLKHVPEQMVVWGGVLKNSKKN